MEAHSLLSTAFMAVASCALVHVGFVAFGLESVFDQVGHGVAEAFGGVPAPHA